MKSVRGTEVTDFLRCRTKWDYAWNQKLKPKTPNDKLWFGTLFHKYLESYYTNFSQAQALNDMKKLFDETTTDGMEQVEIDELWELAYNVAENYFATWAKEDNKVEVLATELQFAIPLSDTITYTGTIDLVVKDSYGRVYFYDHKTTSNVESYEKRASMDRQISRYWWALQQLGYNVDGFIYNIVLKDYPLPPTVLKNGSLSQNKSQKTTYELYLSEIQQRGLDPNDYREILDHLKVVGNRFFKRLSVTRTQSEIDNAIQEMLDVTYDMDGARVYRNITKDCSWDCPFQSICQSSMDGSDVTYLTEQLFVKGGE
jgi:RecB family exonuclease